MFLKSTGCVSSNKVDNASIPTKSHITEQMEADLMDMPNKFDYY
jgi:hypothetical protein